jgi:prophage maintenance system killer protein
MKYSFITPRKKSVLTPELQLLFIFFAITFFMIFMTYMFLLFKDYRFTQDKEYMIKQLWEINDSQLKMENRIKLIHEERLLGERIYTQNIVLKDSITNLFDLVPLRITLSEAKLLKNGLILYGITPNEDVYNFMLQAPLRSIFSSTYSSFYPAENGWLRFVSTNYIDEDDLRKKTLKPKVEEEVDNED